jgi:hypothetical protein
MLWNWLTRVFRPKSMPLIARRIYAKRRPVPLDLEVLEARVMLVVGGVAVAPGTPFDGVVRIANNQLGSGSLLYDKKAKGDASNC